MRYISQFHNHGEGVPTMKYIMGKYDPLVKPILGHIAGKKYISQRYNSGTFCELSKSPRTIEIQVRNFIFYFFSSPSCIYSYLFLKIENIIVLIL
jgi:hypothetical protein